MFVFLATLYGIARSKSSRVYLDVQQAFAELKAVQKRWLESAKQELQERRQQFERRYAEIVAQRDRALANVEAKAAHRLADATARKQRERAEADQRYPALLAEIAERRDEQLRSLDEDFQKKMTDLAAAKREASEAAQRESAQRSAQRTANENRARAALAEKWRSGTSQFLRTVADFESECSRAAIDWSAMRNNGWTLPEQVLRPIRVGHYDLDFAKIPDGLPRDPQLRPDPAARRAAAGPSVSLPARLALVGMPGRGTIGRRRRHSRHHA